MKLLISVLLFFIIVPTVVAQDSTWILSASSISKSGKIYFDADKWIFRQGNGAGWASVNIDTKDWKKISPEKLNELSSAADGRVEGWFRIKMKTDSTVANMPFRLYSMAWAAADIYLDGKLIQSFGNTGSNGRPFKEYNPYEYQTAALPLVVGKEHVLAWHFVDEVSPFGGNSLKSNDFSPAQWLYITSIKFERKWANDIKVSRMYDGILISTTVVLSLLFWLLAFLTPNDKNLKWIATGSSLLALLSISVPLSRIEIFSYLPNAIFGIFCVMVTAMIFLLNPVILAKIFHRKIKKVFKITLIVCAIICSIFIFKSLQIGNMQNSSLILALIGLGIPFFLSFYYVFSSWKNLRGAQWAVVIGFLISVICLLFYIIASFSGLFSDGTVNMMIPVMFYTLSPPLGMLVYVSLRFKEILREVQTNNEQVLQLSEEKRQQALNQQKNLEEEVERQTADLKNTLTDLKSTQTQLIQSEKMASLGELTAGIAHEIQNPLNFVNNFSEVNTEMIDEATEEMSKGNYEEVKNILSDVKENSEKINHHGKRADAIVKGMLQHSRSSSGQKEPTDINALCDEYLRLSYHGLRAKDKSFNATLKTDFDESIGKINIVPQDIGRVIMNLLTNAFYAVNERRKTDDRPPTTGDQPVTRHPQPTTEPYVPTISISTQKLNDTINIIVEDNGAGIPDSIKEKIFQPFFTTKPTGQGTGLGLSLSYDIITKGHGGELKSTTRAGQGSTFIIHLPA